MGWGQQAWSVLFGFTWSSIHRLVIRMAVLLGIDTIGPAGYYWVTIDTIGPAEEEGISRALEMLPGGSDIIICIGCCSRNFQEE